MFPFRRNVLAFAALLALSSPVLAGKLAIVIDDFGYRPHNENQVLAMPSAISVAVLPDSPHAREMATKAHNSGHEVLIHLPMAPLSKQPLEKNTLRPEMSSDEIERIIRSAVNNVPYAVGINNHMGSKMTSNLFGMQKVMQALERYNLYFLDSVTIGNTQAMRAAQGTGVKVIKRKVFLDDSQNEADIRVQFNRAIDLARRNGSTILAEHKTGETAGQCQKSNDSGSDDDPQVDAESEDAQHGPAEVDFLPRQCMRVRGEAAVGNREVGGLHRPLAFFRRTRAMSTGAPTNAVMTPTWSSPGFITTLPMTSEARSRMGDRTTE